MNNVPVTHRSWLIPGICLLMILSFTVFGERGLLRIYEMKQEMRRIEKRTAELKVENQRWSLTIEGLRSDRGQLERIGKDNVRVVTGPAGSGKTTWIKNMLRDTKIEPDRVFPCAPTGVERPAGLSERRGGGWASRHISTFGQAAKS